MKVLLGVLLFLLFALVVGKLCGRLIGLRLGRWRGLAVGTIGFVVGSVATAYAIGDKTGDNGRTLNPHGFGEWVGTIGVVVFFGVLAAMPATIAIDLLTRAEPGRPPRRRRSLLHPFRSLGAAIAPYRRFAEVAENARRAGLLHFRYASRSALDSPELARRLRVVLEESGGMLVKFGQIASTRSDILPAALIDELANLRANVRPFGAEEVREVVEAELGEPVEKAFASFEWEPLAGASIGQTHRAVLDDGASVVVKVQRPGVGELVGRDAAVLRLAARRLERRSEGAQSLGLCVLVEELIAGVEEELDYRHEGSVGMRLREHRSADVGIAVPRVYPTLCSDRILVMEEVVGRTIGDTDAVDESPVPRPELARRLLSSFLGQILDDGMYHADPHPGNLLIDAEGSIWLLDFGSVGRLDARALEGLRDIALGVAANDPYVLARAARDLAVSDGLVDVRALEADISVQLADLDGPVGIDPRLVGRVLEVMQRHELRPPRSMTLLARSLLTLEGTLRIIDPSFNISTASQQMVMEEHRDALGTPEEILRREVMRQLPPLRTLPEHAETLANQLRSGRLTVRTERFAGEDRGVVEDWVDRVVLAMIGGSIAVTSGLLFIAAAQTENDGLRETFWILGFFAGAFASIVLMRLAARMLRRQAGQID